MTPKQQPTHLALDEAVLGDTLRLAFAQRRKTLRNNMKGFVTSEQLETLGLDPQRRPETLSLEEFVKLANFRAE